MYRTSRHPLYFQKRTNLYLSYIHPFVQRRHSCYLWEFLYCITFFLPTRARSNPYAVGSLKIHRNTHTHTHRHTHTHTDTTLISGQMNWISIGDVTATIPLLWNNSLTQPITGRGPSKLTVARLPDGRHQSSNMSRKKQATSYFIHS